MALVRHWTRMSREFEVTDVYRIVLCNHLLYPRLKFQCRMFICADIPSKQGHKVLTPMSTGPEDNVTWSSCDYSEMWTSTYTRCICGGTSSIGVNVNVTYWDNVSIHKHDVWHNNISFLSETANNLILTYTCRYLSEWTIAFLSCMCI